jgi:hypothetical protein
MTISYQIWFLLTEWFLENNIEFSKLTEEDEGYKVITIPQMTHWGGSRELMQIYAARR